MDLEKDNFEEDELSGLEEDDELGGEDVVETEEEELIIGGDEEGDEDPAEAPAPKAAKPAPAKSAAKAAPKAAAKKAAPAKKAAKKPAAKAKAKAKPKAKAKKAAKPREEEKEALTLFCASHRATAPEALCTTVEGGRQLDRATHSQISKSFSRPPSPSGGLFFWCVAHSGAVCRRPFEWLCGRGSTGEVRSYRCESATISIGAPNRQPRQWQ